MRFVQSGREGCRSRSPQREGLRRRTSPWHALRSVGEGGLPEPQPAKRRAAIVGTHMKTRVLQPPCIALVLVAGLVPVIFTSTAGCASDKYGPPKTAWDDDRPELDRPAAGTSASAANGASAAPTANPGGAPVKKSAADVASGKSTADACMDNAEKIGGDSGVALVRECMHRSDYFDLARAVKEPWLPKMRTNEQLQARVVEVIARRGGFLERDAPVLKRGKLPMLTLEEAIEKNAKLGSLVIARGTVQTIASEKWGKGKGLVAHIAETSWLDAEGAAVEGEAPTIADVELANPARTGRMFYVRVENKGQLKRSDDVVVLMTVEGPRAAQSSGEDDGEVDGASLIGMYVASANAAQQLRE